MKIKQYNLGQWIGAIRVQTSRAQFYISIIQLLLVAVAAKSQLQIWFPWLSFYIIIFVLILLTLIISVVDWMFVYPGEVEYLNRQSVKHPNPVWEKINAINDRKEEKKE